MLTYEILGVKIHGVNMAESLSTMEGFLQDEGTHLVVTIGPEMVMRALENQEFLNLVQGADLVVPDGTGILWAASQCGLKLPERVAGIDLIINFAKILAKRQEKLFLLGAAANVAEKAGEKLRELIPDLQIVGCHDGYFKDPLPIVEMIKKTQASVVYAALGSPAQERWIRTYGPQAGIKVGIGVGGSFDVLSGLKKRAPDFMIKMRLEWLYRFLSEPSRAGRMLAIPRFMIKIKKAGPQAFKQVSQ